MSDFELWFGRLVDPDKVPTTAAQCIDIYVDETRRTCNEELTPEQRTAAASALQLYYVALKSTPGMVKFLEQWFVSRAMGNKCPEDQVLYLPRESGHYATAMRKMTETDDAMFADYDRRLAASLVDAPFEVVAAGVCIAYVLPIAGLESQFAYATHARLEQMRTDTERREALGMASEWEFESDAIAEMTRISVGEAVQRKDEKE